MLISYQFFIQDQSGDVQPYSSYEVRDSDTNELVSIYSDQDGTTSISNPSTADSNGKVIFFIGEGTYDITVSYNGSTHTFTKEFITSVDTLAAIARANNTTVDNVAYLATGINPAGAHYLYEASTGYIYWTSSSINAEITDTGTDSSGDRTITAGSTYAITRNFKEINIESSDEIPNLTIPVGSFVYAKRYTSGGFKIKDLVYQCMTTTDATTLGFSADGVFNFADAASNVLVLQSLISGELWAEQGGFTLDSDFSDLQTQLDVCMTYTKNLNVTQSTYSMAAGDELRWNPTICLDAHDSIVNMNRDEEAQTFSSIKIRFIDTDTGIDSKSLRMPRVALKNIVLWGDGTTYNDDVTGHSEGDDIDFGIMCYLCNVESLGSDKIAARFALHNVHMHKSYGGITFGDGVDAYGAFWIVLDWHTEDVLYPIIHPTNSLTNSGENNVITDRSICTGFESLIQNNTAMDWSINSASVDWTGTGIISAVTGGCAIKFNNNYYERSLDHGFVDDNGSETSDLTIFVSNAVVLPRRVASFFGDSASANASEFTPFNGEGVRYVVNGFNVRFERRNYMPDYAFLCADDIDSISIVGYDPGESNGGAAQLVSRLLARNVGGLLEDASVGDTLGADTIYGFDTTDVSFGNYAVVDDTYAYVDGSYSFQCTTTSTSDYCPIPTDTFKVDPGDLVLAGFKIYAGTATGDLNVTINVKFYDEQDTVIETLTQGAYTHAANTYDDEDNPNYDSGNRTFWTQTRTSVVRAPAGSATAQVIFFVSNFVGDVWCNDFMVNCVK